jgi:hypothetical protein
MVDIWVKIRKAKERKHTDVLPESKIKQISTGDYGIMITTYHKTVLVNN